eukprot:scaffold301117_cov30-Tisochrysis_lutea.AAC.4
MPADAHWSAFPDGWSVRREVPIRMPPSDAHRSGDKPTVRRASCSAHHAIEPVSASPGARCLRKPALR